MAVEVFFTRDLAGNLKAADDASLEAIKELKPGRTYRADVVMPRNPKRLRWWWKLASIVADNSEHYPSQKAVSDMLKLKCGHFETLVIPGKEAGSWVTTYVPGSIAFGSMTEPHFKQLCNDAVRVCAEVLDCQSDELHEALHDFFTGRAAA